MNKVRRSGGRWVADFLDPATGKRRRVTAATQQQAQERMKFELAAVGDVEPRAAAFTMKEAMALTHQMRWAGKASEANAMGYCRQVVEFYGPGFPIAKVDAQSCMRMHQFFLQKGNSNATVNWKHSCLSSMLKCSELMGHIKGSPRLPDSLPIAPPKDRVITPREQEAFVAYFQAICEPEAADMFTFLIDVGCRWSEAERMRSGEIDLKRRCVYLPKTKNGKPRTVPLTGQAISAVEGRLSPVKKYKVFSYTYKQFQYLFSKAKGALGLEYDKQLSIHTLRHTCASRLAAKGVSLPAIQAWGGWSSLGAIQKYLHLDITGLEMARRALESECVPSVDRQNAMAELDKHLAEEAACPVWE
jgi:site-specific recombinase XerD